MFGDAMRDKVIPESRHMCQPESSRPLAGPLCVLRQLGLARLQVEGHPRRLAGHVSPAHRGVADPGGTQRADGEHPEVQTEGALADWGKVRGAR